MTTETTTKSTADTVDGVLTAAGEWLSRADEHYRQAARYNQQPESSHRADVELSLAAYAKERADDLRELVRRGESLLATGTTA